MQYELSDEEFDALSHFYDTTDSSILNTKLTADFNLQFIPPSGEDVYFYGMMAPGFNGILKGKAANIKLLRSKLNVTNYDDDDY